MKTVQWGVPIVLIEEVFLEMIIKTSTNSYSNFAGRHIDLMQNARFSEAVNTIISPFFVDS